MDECWKQSVQEQRTARELYGVLLELAEAELYDHDFMQGLTALQQLAADKSLLSYLKARMYYAREQYDLAEKEIQEAIDFRAIDFRYWELMGMVQEKKGNLAGKYYYEALLWAHKKNKSEFVIPLDDEKLMRAIGQAMVNPGQAPFSKKYYFEEGRLKGDYGNVAGQYLRYDDDGDYQDYCGVYNPYGWINMRSDMAVCLDGQHHAPQIYCDMPFEIMKCITRTEMKVDVTEHDCILPIAPQERNQVIEFCDADTKRQISCGRWEFSYYRLEKGSTMIRSSAPFQVAEPVLLRHSKKRKKLVLNILADGLAWQVLKKQGYKDVPNIMRFFSKGIIFDNNFSVAEHTYPSLPTIETGCYTYHTQVFHDLVQTQLSKKMPVISEQMKALGYYCVNVMSDAAGIYNGVLRGFDRNIIHNFTNPCYEAVNRCMEHLDAFGETDNYLYMHISDAHPFNSYIQIAAPSQTRLSWKDRILEEYSNSVFKKKSVLNMSSNQYDIRHMDRVLGQLFEYIEAHYRKDEYVVSLYSDHGVSIYDDEPYLLSENQSGAAMMLRGAGIPSAGLVEELTSVVDFYPVLAEVLGFSLPYEIDGCLPVAFGGPGRKYAVSMSIYPGQTFKLCLRDREYEFRLESAALTQLEGLVDMRDYYVHIYRRTDGQEIFDQGIRERFLSEAWNQIKSFVLFD
ncbi:Sulfatase [Selenomonas ruminantium]|uniref:Sulfatase n=1 Tax=Selenomonas ruminantium TaxID=971 RepID=A0A1M6ULZ5_SELRU|nr:sulfatase-like hydrolase/transferase [Selenomonas ruminantium]SHK70128.1 Sulfatase [Selenomonas ruminantium]